VRTSRLLCRTSMAIKAHDSRASASTIGTSVLNDFHRFRLKPVGMPPPSLVSDFRRLINNAELADISFVVEGKIVHAHRAVLACRSEYFRVMLLGGMKESRMTDIDTVEANDAGQNSPIELQDVSHTVFFQVCETRGKVGKQYWASDNRILTRSKVLEYLYTDAVSSMSLDSGIHLMIASERFMLDRLKSLCEDAIRRDIDVDNCIEILVASHSHRAGNLKEIALDFIMQHLGNPKIQNGLSVSRSSFRLLDTWPDRNLIPFYSNPREEPEARGGPSGRDIATDYRTLRAAAPPSRW
jgi:BTB/POZ domain